MRGLVLAPALALSACGSGAPPPQVSPLFVSSLPCVTLSTSETQAAHCIATIRDLYCNPDGGLLSHTDAGASECR